jgi:hypothetical protein
MWLQRSADEFCGWTQRFIEWIRARRKEYRSQGVLALVQETGSCSSHHMISFLSDYTNHRPYIFWLISSVERFCHINGVSIIQVQNGLCIKRMILWDAPEAETVNFAWIDRALMATYPMLTGLYRTFLPSSNFQSSLGDGRVTTLLPPGMQNPVRFRDDKTLYFKVTRDVFDLSMVP